MKNLAPIPYAIVTFLISFPILFGVDYVIETFVRHNAAWQPNIVHTIVIAIAAGVGAYFYQANRQDGKQ